MSAAESAGQPWVEKYRPATIDEVAQQEEVVAALRGCLRTGELPNLLFYGPPGTGKTSTALALVQQLFGKAWRTRVKELNASDERGISAIREQVKTFAQLSIGTTGDSLIDAKARFRVVILDEADSMTHDAQAALRRIMEEFVAVTRFIIICNYVSKIIEPLHSRCSKFPFQPIGVEFQKSRILQICKHEGLNLGPGALDAIVEHSKGDLRCAVTMLQTAVSFYGEADAAAIGEVACIVPDAVCRDLLAKASHAKNTHEVINVVRRHLMEGYSGQQVIEHVMQLVTQDLNVADLAKAKCALLISQVEERLTLGADEELQLVHLFSSLRPLLKVQ
mmetsp:Transcript_37318/g.84274  ORF Transcript_37318/g.84274 Transcript_37318/m.84274 type:complete len:334 (-) Transcript_37318:144-1145(-)